MTEPPFRRIAIVGVGLIGGSIVQAAKQAWPSIDATGIDVQDDLARVAGAELVVLAAPVRANIALLAAIQPSRVGARGDHHRHRQHQARDLRGSGRLPRT